MWERYAMTASARSWLRIGTVIFLLGLVVAALVTWLNLRGERPMEAALPAAPPSVEFLQRGAYLAKVGNCVSCHTARGAPAFAGGSAIETPFGAVYASNITPDLETGIGHWSADHFWRAMHHGRSRDGHLLYPAFPYPDYTRITREDSDALYAFLRSQSAVKRPNHAHDLRFPYNLQASLAVWRAMFFRPATFEPDQIKSAEFNRGAYLVRGLGHCQSTLCGAWAIASPATLPGTCSERSASGWN
jgi:mono/diheme cytochrome c family protein